MPSDAVHSRCGPCKLLAGHMSKIEPHYAGTVRFEKVDVGKNYELARHYKITKLPTLLLFQGDQQVGFLGGRPHLEQRWRTGCSGHESRHLTR